MAISFKRFLLAISFLILSTTAFSLPSVNTLVNDISGQYVYYRDNSFGRESYIGVLYYDEATYAFRYYAPACGSGSKFKPEKNIHILFTINPDKKNLELTGERIITSIKPEDSDLINYIHDFFYELTSRRQNIGDLNENKSEYQVYEQFGGNVTLYFNPLIPIFNLERIDSVDKKTILQIVTAGQLSSSEDQSFANFSGITSKFKDKNHKFKKDKKAKTVNIEYQARENSQTLKANLDSSWVAAAENFYTLKEVAFFTVNEICSPTENQFEVLKRHLLLGRNSVYPLWEDQKIEIKNNGILFTQISYHKENNSYTYDFKFLKIIDKKTAGLFTLTCFAGAYEKNKKYFNSIIDTFQ